MHLAGFDLYGLLVDGAELPATTTPHGAPHNSLGGGSAAGAQLLGRGRSSPGAMMAATPMSEAMKHQMEQRRLPMRSREGQSPGPPAISVAGYHGREGSEAANVVLQSPGNSAVGQRRKMLARRHSKVDYEV